MKSYCNGAYTRLDIVQLRMSDNDHESETPVKRRGIGT